jgi:hypothetical protein
MLEEWGPGIPFPYSSQVEGRLRELRVHYGRTIYRILYYGDAQRTFVLLHAFEKRSLALPEAELRVAMKRMAKDQERKRREDVKKESRYQQFKARALRKPRVRKAYEEGLEDLRIAVRLAELRERRGMTQTQTRREDPHQRGSDLAAGARTQCGV